MTAAQLRDFISHLDSMIDLSKLQDNTPFTEAGADSLDFFNVIIEIQEASGVVIDDHDIEKVNTLAGLAAYLNARMKG